MLFRSTNYLPRAKVLGYDIEYRGKLQQLPSLYPNIEVRLQNGYDYASLSSTPMCDILIDDGPHSVESQLFFVKNYSLKLKAGGMLIIEDIDGDNNLDKIRAHVPFHLHQFVKIYDFRKLKNRHDDLMLTIELPA